ncbi:MAG: hypothetical protein IPM92_15685 [Saprospiraceae bacterium]|nr:hypothetical protein [Saprospiraceae bacterium]
MNTLSYIWIAVALLTYVSLQFVTAPFGRHTHEKWGTSISNKWGWFIMELPSLMIMCYFFYTAIQGTDSYVWILFLLWIVHYFNRTIVYPLRIKTTPKKMPLLIVCSAIFFNVVNAGLNGNFLAEAAAGDMYTASWLSSTHFLMGLPIFLLGMWINWKSDDILIQLRKGGDTGYHIPRGFLFEFVSSPNLLGEIIEWIGFAVMAWNLPALSFAVWTLANLVPRAMRHHRWYLENFRAYPIKRKALIPYLI